MASDRGQNRYSDFVALETLLRFENCSSSHCLLSSWRRFHVFESSHPSFHRTVVFVESVPCLRVVASPVSSYCTTVVFVASVSCLRVVASLVSSYCCLRGVGFMSSSRRIPRFIVLLSSWRRFHVFESSHPSFHRTVVFESCLLSSWRRFHVFESSHPSFHRTVFFGALLFLCLRVVGFSFRRLRYILEESSFFM